MIDYVAGGLELTGLFALGNKKRYGFLLSLVGNAGWIYVAFATKLYGLLLVVIPAMILNIRNYRKWQRES
jgi:nicotinamide riboside transporter PnuC